jgi:sulfur carrier protein
LSIKIYHFFDDKISSYFNGLMNTFNLSQVTLQVNGDRQTCPSQTLLPQFLEQIGLNPRLVAVEYNGEILHRQYWPTTLLQEGDRLEIVTIVGGG